MTGTNPKVAALEHLVEVAKEFHDFAPTALKSARLSLWRSRLLMFFTIALVIFNILMDISPPWLCVTSRLLCAFSLVQAIRLLILNEKWWVRIRFLTDKSASDLKRWTALLEDARSLTANDERPNQ